MKLVVVADMFMTDTARAAHVFLPRAGPLEEDDVLMSYCHTPSATPGSSGAAGAPRSDQRSGRLWPSGWGLAKSSPNPTAVDRVTPQAHGKHGVMLGALAERGWMRDPKADGSVADGPFPPTGKIELWSSSASRGVDPLPGYIRPAEVVCGDPAHTDIHGPGTGFTRSSTR